MYSRILSLWTKKIMLRTVLQFVATLALALGSPVLQPEAADPVVDALNATVADALNATTVMLPDESYPAVSIADKQVAEAKSAAADKTVSSLELQRDAAWQTARGNLAVATHPPIRSSAVLGLLSKETDKFAALEAAIKKAKDEAAHQRRVAELTGGAWDAHESRRLKGLKTMAAEAALADARVSETKERENEAEVSAVSALTRPAGFPMQAWPRVPAACQSPCNALSSPLACPLCAMCAKPVADAHPQLLRELVIEKQRVVA